MQTISSVMKHEHDIILQVVDALEKNAEDLMDGHPFNPEFYLKFIDFQRNYADKFHHAKEENILFPELQKQKETADNPEIKLLIHQHILTRAYVDNIEKALESENIRKIITNAIDYGKMIRGHIKREDNQYFPLVERLLPEKIKDKIVGKFTTSDAELPKGSNEKYIALAKEIRTMVKLKKN